MKKHLSILIVLFTATIAIGFMATRSASADPSQQAIANAIIAREKASFEAWQKKDKAFMMDLLTDDATYFGAMSPYLETEPKVNFFPKFEQYAEMIKYQDFQMYNSRVQVYGDTAILTYNSSVMATLNGQPLQYTGKMTSVYVKQGNTWRVVHGHESINPAAK